MNSASPADMRTVMILGAGVYQVPLIQRARAMQLRTVVLSRAGPYPGIPLADVFMPVDTTDTEAVLRVARGYGIDAVCTTGTDVCLPSLGAVVDACALHGPGYDSACRSMDKTQMKDAFVKHNVPTPGHRVVADYEACLDAAQQIGYPVVIKAPDSSGSRGVTMAQTVTDLPGAWARAFEVSRSGSILVEEHLDGMEFGAQVVVHGAEVTAIIPHRDTVTPPPWCAPIGHSLPIELNESERALTEDALVRAVAALGLRDCIANADLMLVQGEPCVLELGGRMGATCLPECISRYAGFDAYEHVLRLALGERPDLSMTGRQANAGLLLRSPGTGVLRSIHVPEQVSAHPRLVELRIDFHAGDPVREFVVGPDRIGHVVVQSENALAAEQLACSLAAAIEVEVYPAA